MTLCQEQSPNATFSAMVLAGCICTLSSQDTCSIPEDSAVIFVGNTSRALLDISAAASAPCMSHQIHSHLHLSYVMNAAADPDFNQKLESVITSLEASGIGSSSGSAPAPVAVPMPRQQQQAVPQAGSSTQGSRREQISSPNKPPPTRYLGLPCMQRKTVVGDSCCMPSKWVCCQNSEGGKSISDASSGECSGKGHLLGLVVDVRQPC